MTTNKKLWWKAYFWLIVVLALGAIWYELRDEESLALPDIADYGAWFFSLLGVFGFAYSTLIFNRRVWQAWLPIVVFWDLAILGKEYLYEPIEVDVGLILFTALIAGILVLPEYVALYHYGYRNKSLWEKSI